MNIPHPISLFSRRLLTCIILPCVSLLLLPGCKSTVTKANEAATEQITEDIAIAQQRVQAKPHDARASYDLADKLLSAALLDQRIESYQRPDDATYKDACQRLQTAADLYPTDAPLLKAMCGKLKLVIQPEEGRLFLKLHAQGHAFRASFRRLD